MRISVVLLVLCLSATIVAAQPAGSAAGSAAAGAPAGSATGSAGGPSDQPAPVVGSAGPSVPGSAAVPPPVAPTVAGPQGHPVDANIADKRKACADAMNADPSFAIAIVKTINEKTAASHVDAARRVAKNERHVILAYAAMWVIAAGFVLFLWRRQQHLKTEIAQLRRDLDAAEKPGK